MVKGYDWRGLWYYHYISNRKWSTSPTGEGVPRNHSGPLNPSYTTVYNFIPGQAGEQTASLVSDSLPNLHLGDDWSILHFFFEIKVKRSYTGVNYSLIKSHKGHNIFDNLSWHEAEWKVLEVISVCASWIQVRKTVIFGMNDRFGCPPVRLCGRAKFDKK